MNIYSIMCCIYGIYAKSLIYTSIYTIYTVYMVYINCIYGIYIGDLSICYNVVDMWMMAKNPEMCPMNCYGARSAALNSHISTSE